MIRLPISKLEKNLTFLIASKWTHPKLDQFMVIVSDPYRWLLPAITLTMVLIYQNWSSGIGALLLGGISAGAADGINSRYLKKVTDRVRPGKQYPEIRSLGVMNRGRKSFPSNHASNTMAFALGFALFFPATGWILIPLSFLVGYSRIYCGAHFPLDVVTGWLHGIFWVILLYSVFGLLSIP